MTYYAIDFETANDYPNSACSVGVVRFADGIEQDSVYSLIKPAKMYFKPEFIDIHHISYGDVRNEPQFPEVWQTIVEPFVGNGKTEPIYFVAHNAKFDLKFLNFYLKKYYLETIDNHICTLEMLKKCKSYKGKNKKLETACNYYNIVNENAHRADSDTKATAELFLIIKDEVFPGLI